MKTCPICSSPTTGQQIYCSRVCQNRARTIARKATATPCVHCGKPVAKGGAKYCGMCMRYRKQDERVARALDCLPKRTGRMLTYEACGLQVLGLEVRKVWNPLRHNYYIAEIGVIR